MTQRINLGSRTSEPYQQLRQLHALVEKAAADAGLDQHPELAARRPDTSGCGPGSRGTGRPLQLGDKPPKWMITAHALAQWEAGHPDEDRDGFLDRYLQVATTFSGAG